MYCSLPLTYQIPHRPTRHTIYPAIDLEAAQLISNKNYYTPEIEPTVLELPPDNMVPPYIIHGTSYPNFNLGNLSASPPPNISKSPFPRPSPGYVHPNLTWPALDEIRTSLEFNIPGKQKRPPTINSPATDTIPARGV